MSSSFTHSSCYKIATKQKSTYDSKLIGNTISSHGMFYLLRINESALGKADIRKFLYSRNHGNTLIDMDAAFSSFVGRGISSSGLINANSFLESYFIVTKQSLSKPFQNFVNYYYLRYLDKEDCTAQCTSQLLLRKMNRIPFFVISKNDSLGAKIISVDDLKKSLKLLEFKSIIDFCSHKACEQPDCSNRKYFIDDSLLRNRQFVVGASIPTFPFIVINSHPKFTNTEVAVYLLSCFGTCFGISALSS